MSGEQWFEFSPDRRSVSAFQQAFNGWLWGWPWRWLILKYLTRQETVEGLSYSIEEALLTFCYRRWWMGLTLEQRQESPIEVTSVPPIAVKFRRFVLEPEDVPRLQVLVRRKLPGPEVVKMQGRRIAELLVDQLYRDLLSGRTLHIDGGGVRLLPARGSLEIKVLADNFPCEC